MSQDWTRASLNVMSPRLGSPSLPKVCPAMVTEPGQPYRPYSEYPSATAAAVEVTLKVEPGAYWPWVVQLMIGCPPDLPNSALNCRWEMPPVHTLGS